MKSRLPSLLLLGVVVVLVVSLVGGVNGSSDLPFINVHVVAHSHCDPGKSI